MKLCGIDTALLRLPPTPEELAAIVARMDPAQVALFIAIWSEQINFSNGPRAEAHIQAIGEAIVNEDASAGCVPGDGHGVGLIQDIHIAIAKALPR